jgi:hypothetical protein
MFLVSSVLVTIWMACVVLGFTLGGATHLLAIAAVAIIFASGNHREQPAPLA